MENKQNWELIVNTCGDVTKTMLLLNGELIPCAKVNLLTSAELPAFLEIKIPIVDGNLKLTVNENKPVYREVITATTDK